VRLGVALALALGAGCAGELEAPERFSDCPPGYVEEMFATRCAGLCHSGSTPEAGLDLVSPGVQGRMVGATSESLFCEGRVLVEPGAAEPRQHLLIDKISEAPSCGGRMPFGGEALTITEQACVRAWIDEALGVEAAP